MHSHHARLTWLFALGLLVACESKPTPNPFDTPASADKPAPKLSAPPKLEGPPPIRIEEHGPKVGWDEVLIEKEDGRERLKKALAGVKDAYQGKPVELVVSRKARTVWVAAMLDELGTLGVGDITVVTETRTDFSPKLGFVPQAQAGKQPSCALTMMILKDRATAVWTIGGGTAGRRAKGMAGPDLTTTADTIERKARACDDTSTYFVSAAEDVEWGLTYDLAASAQKIEKVKLNRAVLLSEVPVAGRPVKL